MTVYQGLSLIMLILAAYMAYRSHSLVKRAEKLLGK